MADDERRAEIEAMLAAWPRFSFIADGLEPSEVNPSQRARREALLLVILPALDRVRDARGDDEKQWACDACEDTGIDRREGIPCGCGARSPQGEDHEGEKNDERRP